MQIKIRGGSNHIGKENDKKEEEQPKIIRRKTQAEIEAFFKRLSTPKVSRGNNSIIIFYKLAHELIDRNMTRKYKKKLRKIYWCITLL